MVARAPRMTWQRNWKHVSLSVAGGDNTAFTTPIISSPAAGDVLRCRRVVVRCTLIGGSARDKFTAGWVGLLRYPNVEVLNSTDVLNLTVGGTGANIFGRKIWERVGEQSLSFEVYAPSINIGSEDVLHLVGIKIAGNESATMHMLATWMEQPWGR